MFSFLQQADETKVRTRSSVELNYNNKDDYYRASKQLLDPVEAGKEIMIALDAAAAPSTSTLDQPKSSDTEKGSSSCLNQVKGLLSPFCIEDCLTVVNYWEPAESLSPLIIASEKGLDDVVSLLLDKGAEIDAPNDFGSTSLYFAAQSGRLSTVKLLVRNGANVEKPNISNWTPLFAAASEGFHKIVEVLLDSGAQPDIVDKDKMSPLALAVKSNHIEVVRLLIAARAALQSNLSPHGVTPLMVACYYGYEEIASLIVHAGADVNCVDKDGLSALFFAAQKGHVKIVKLLVQCHAAINIANAEGLTPLHETCRNNHLECAKILVYGGADINSTSSSGPTDDVPLLSTVCSLGYIEIIKLLLYAPNIDINKLDSNKWTALHVAVARNHSNVVKLLLERGVDPNLRNMEGATALYLAACHGHTSCLTHIIKHCTSTNTSAGGCGSSITDDMSNGNDKDSSSSSSNNNSSLSLVNLPNNVDWTPLFIASCNGHQDAVKVLLDSEAIIEAKTTDGTTALFVASRAGHLPIVMLLLARGASPNIPNNDGLTALYAAVEEGHDEVAAALIDKDADIYRTYSTTRSTTSAPYAVFGQDSISARPFAAISNMTIRAAGTTARASSTAVATATGETRSRMHSITPRSNNNSVAAASALIDAHMRSLSASHSTHSHSNSRHNALSKHKSIFMVNASDKMQRVLRRKLVEDKKKKYMLNEQFFTLVQNGELEEATTLLSTYPDIDVSFQDAQGWSPLFAAALEGHVALAKMLLACPSIDINVTTYNLLATPLYGACHAGNIEIIRLLVQRPDCDLNKPDINGITPLIIGCCTSETGQKDVVGVIKALLGFLPLPPVESIIADTASIDLASVALTTTSSPQPPPIPTAVAKDVGEVTERQYCPPDKPAGWKLRVDVNAVDVSGTTAVFVLCCGGCLEGLQILLTEGGADPNVTHESGSWSLMAAVVDSHTEIVRYLCQREDVQVNKIDTITTGNSCMIEAAGRNSLEIMRILLNKGADVNFLSFENVNAVYCAAHAGHTEAVSMLLVAGADPNVLCSELKSSAMHAALEEGHLETGMIILKLSDGRLLASDCTFSGVVTAAATTTTTASATPASTSTAAEGRGRGGAGMPSILHPFIIDIKDANGCTALWDAAYRGMLEMVRDLHRAGADINVRDTHDKRSALYVAAAHGHVPVVKYLLQQGANAEVQDYYGRTAAFIAQGNAEMRAIFECTPKFILAVKSGDLATCRELNKNFGDIINVAAQSAFLDINGRDNDGFCAIHAAAGFDRIEILKQLVGWGADINAPSTTDWTPLMTASLQGKTRCVQYLLSLGAKHDLKNHNGSTALLVATLKGRKEVVKVLLDYDASLSAKRAQTTTTTTSGSGSSSSTTSALVNMDNNKGETPLFVAAFCGYIDIVALLLRANADIHKAVYADGNTPLIVAVFRDHLEIVKLIIDQYPHAVDQVNRSGCTSLMIASAGKNSDIVEYLLAHGADRTLRNTEGDTADSMLKSNEGLSEPGQELSVMRRTVTDDSTFSMYSGVEFI